MVSNSRLTEFQQRANASGSIVDLSTGYPQTSSPDDRWTRYVRIVNGLAGAPSDRTTEVESTVAGVRDLLGLGPQQQVLVSNSGSVALARTLVALADDRRALVTVPGFDSIYSLAAEATAKEPSTVLLDPFCDHDTWFQRLIESVTGDIGLVVVVTPDNPSGRTLSALELEQLGRSCAAVDAKLVLDQCFALVSPYGTKVPLGTVLDDQCGWCVLWDTSKVVNLAGEKLGFVIPGESVADSVAKALRVIQLELPLTALRTVRGCLAEAKQADEFDRLNARIRLNYESVARVSAEVGLKVNVPEAGSFVLLNTDGTRFAGDSDGLALELLARGVAVASSRIMTPVGSPIPSEFIRIGLAHSFDHIELFENALLDIVNGS